MLTMLHPRALCVLRESIRCNNASKLSFDFRGQVRTKTDAKESPKTSSKQAQLNESQIETAPNASIGTIDTHLKTIPDFPLFVQTYEKNEEIQNEKAWEFVPLVKQLIQDSPKVPSVSTILSATMSEESRLALKKWEMKKIKELGEEGFQQYKKELFANGHNFHSCIEDYLVKGVADGDLNLFKANRKLWESVEPVFEHISDVRMVETTVQHPMLGYMGIFDCVARYRNKLLIIDWKTSERVKSQLKYTYDNPLQLVAYLGALNHDPSFDMKLKEALLVVAYKDGRQAHVHRISADLCRKYWHAWLHRVALYWSIKMRDGSRDKAP